MQRDTTSSVCDRLSGQSRHLPLIHLKRPDVGRLALEITRRTAGQGVAMRSKDPGRHRSRGSRPAAGDPSLAPRPSRKASARPWRHHRATAGRRPQPGGSRPRNSRACSPSSWQRSGMGRDHSVEVVPAQCADLLPSLMETAVDQARREDWLCRRTNTNSLARPFGRPGHRRSRHARPPTP